MVYDSGESADLNESVGSGDSVQSGDSGEAADSGESGDPSESRVSIQSCSAHSVKFGKYGEWHTTVEFDVSLCFVASISLSAFA